MYMASLWMPGGGERPSTSVPESIVVAFEIPHDGPRVSLLDSTCVNSCVDVFEYRLRRPDSESDAMRLQHSVLMLPTWS